MNRAVELIKAAKHLRLFFDKEKFNDDRWSLLEAILGPHLEGAIVQFMRDNRVILARISHIEIAGPEFTKGRFYFQDDYCIQHSPLMHQSVPGQVLPLEFELSECVPTFDQKGNIQAVSKSQSLTMFVIYIEISSMHEIFQKK